MVDGIALWRGREWKMVYHYGEVENGRWYSTMERSRMVDGIALLLL